MQVNLKYAKSSTGPNNIQKTVLLYKQEINLTHLFFHLHYISGNLSGSHLILKYEIRKRRLLDTPLKIKSIKL